MNRNHLALFHAVAAAGSVSAAAQRLRISQPAVSKQIGELEDSIGLLLFDRLPRGMRLTEAGRTLAGYAAKMAILEEDAQRAMSEIRGLQRGRLTVGASTTIGGYLLPQALIQFHRAFPGIDLNLEIANTKTIQAALVAGTLELGLTEGCIASEELETAVFFQDDLVAIARAGSPLLKKAGVTARELCRQPFILREKGSGTRDVIEAALARKGIAVEAAMSLGSTEAIKRAVIAGQGVAIVSRLTVSVELEAKLLGVVRVNDLKIRRPLHRQTLRGRGLGLPAREFLRFLR